ncbi:glycosyltransferase family 4 protein [Devosia rhodophyticola]|uniref:Glycosyltransferase family 4 protein n=2 Tax=Devosia rhodophyticola TaxID=3026423 RepID=A0ABY7Z0X3_9HYPH|nr:glycosyltransferase family 4 protein [Devosia rhodophyticola]
MLLREMVRNGHHCVAFTSDSNHLITPPQFSGASLNEIIDGVEVFWVRTRKYGRAKSLGRILSWLDFEWRLWRMPKRAFVPPDVIIVSSPSLLTIFNGLLLRRHYNCRLVFEVRDIWPLTIVEEGGFSRFNPFVIGLSMIENLAYRMSDAIVGTMPNLSQHVAEVSGSDKPVHCVPMGFDPATLAEPPALPDEYAADNIPADKFIVCHAGTIGATNALDTLLECAKTMQDDPGVFFLLVGDGDLLNEYRLRYGSLANVGFAPAVPKAMVQSVLARCDLAYFSTHPSKVWAYGQSLNKVIDYMLSGKPVVASYSGFPSMISEAGNGSYVAAGDAVALKSEIKRFAAMPREERLAMGRSGRQWIVENRSYVKLAEDYLAIALSDVS